MAQVFDALSYYSDYKAEINAHMVYTWRKDSIRMISARKATRRERKQYES